jgi:predicted amidohydrolase
MSLLAAAAAGKAHWEVLLRARAIECQCFVIAAAQAGVHNEKRESYGHALIIDPWGDVIGRLDDPHAAGGAANLPPYNKRIISLPKEGK